jgi:phosphoglycerate dehydrogenase-like enzyme
MKAVLHFKASARFRERLQAMARTDLSVVVVDEDDDELLFREVKNADVFLHVLKPVTAELIAAAPRLRLIQKLGTGLNTIDRAAAASRGIKVANMPGANSQAVAEHTLALMLAVLRRMVLLDHAMRSGQRSPTPSEMHEAIGEIGGRTVGLVGAGLAGARRTSSFFPSTSIFEAGIQDARVSFSGIRYCVAAHSTYRRHGSIDWARLIILNEAGLHLGQHGEGRSDR